MPFACQPIRLSLDILALSVSLLLGCSGNTTGVDNPGLSELPVSFHDSNDELALVQGDLEIYGQEQNPAIHPEPLIRIPVQNAIETKITANDFQHIETEIVRSKLGSSNISDLFQSAYFNPAYYSSDSLLRFNVLFRDSSNSGDLVFGLIYDAIHKTFRFENGPRQTQLKIQLKSMVAYTAPLTRDESLGELGRVYIPGSPFQATVVDSQFTFPSLPIGQFPLRFLNGRGQIFAVREPMNTQQARLFTMAPKLVAQIDSSFLAIAYSVQAGEDRSLSVFDTASFWGFLSGVQSSDARLSVRWRCLTKAAGKSIWIENPTGLNSRFHFQNTGTYRMELAVTLAAQTRQDTLAIEVNVASNDNAQKFIFPQPGGIMTMGQEGTVQWESSVEGLVRLEYSLAENNFSTWKTLQDSVSILKGWPSYAWTPPVLGTDSLNVMLRVMTIPMDSILVQTAEPFILAPP